MKGFPKVLKTKEDYYNCLAMVASGELKAADLLAKIESAENQRYIECGVAAVEEEKKAVTVYYCDEAAVGMKFVAGDVSGTVQGVTHIQTDEAAAAGEAGNDRTALTLSKAVKAGCKVIALERTDTVAGMTTDDIAALKGVLKQFAFAFAITSRSLLLFAGSGPPSFTATAISRPITVKILPFAASFLSFLCLILANFECPDIFNSPSFLLLSSFGFSTSVIF